MGQKRLELASRDPSETGVVVPLGSSCVSGIRTTKGALHYRSSSLHRRAAYELSRQPKLA